MYRYYHNQPSLQQILPIGFCDNLPNLTIKVINNLNSNSPLLNEESTVVCRQNESIIRCPYGSVEIRRTQDFLVLERIRIIDTMQGIGIGTELMKKAMASVDRINGSLITNVRCYEPGCELTRLLEFFSRFDFHVVGSEYNNAVMYRQNISQRENKG